MSKRILSVLAVGALALGGAACSAGDVGSKAPAAQSTPAAASTPAAVQSTAPASTGAAEFGVPECDAYLEKYLACVESKVPEAVRATMRAQIDQTKSQWKQAASTPEGRTGLAAACKQASEAAGAAMKAYGCSW